MSNNNFPKVLYCFPESAGKVFMPSNGTEGMIFTDAFCDCCIHEKFSHTQNHADKKCDIMSRSIIYWYEPNNPEYPKEWRFNAEGWPVCEAWVKWDWGNDGDPDDPDNPNYRQPDDPNQLCLPFVLQDIERNVTIPQRHYA
jgi:hypothetical protein